MPTHVSLFLQPAMIGVNAALDRGHRRFRSCVDALALSQCDRVGSLGNALALSQCYRFGSLGNALALSRCNRVGSLLLLLGRERVRACRSTMPRISER
jgi:hypothetical protein